MSHVKHVLLITLLLAPLAHGSGEIGLAQSFTEQEISFQSGDLTLHGTVLLPPGEGAWPAVVLVHGAGLGTRDAYRPVAEALTKKGLVTLIYDKRTEGYSASPVGARSYSLLADDAVAAVEALQRRDDVDPAKVGLWGLSEGGWVAPLAASRSTDIAFVITVAGGGIGPAEQSAWGAEQALRFRGVTSPGALKALSDHAYRFFVSAEFFPEGLYDPVPVLERLEQPILALWGANDRLMPPVASANRLKEALDRAGHNRYVIRLIPEADHVVRVSTDGFSHQGSHAPGYVDFMASWIDGVVSGERLGPHIDTLGLEEQTVPPVREASGMARWEAQLALFVAFHLAFGGHFIAGALGRLKRRSRRRAAGSFDFSGMSLGRRTVRGRSLYGRSSLSGLGPSARPGRRRCGQLAARSTALLGLFMPWAVYGFTGYVASTGGHGVGTIVLGRPLGWFLIQLGSAALVVSALALIVSWLRRPRVTEELGGVRFTLLLVGAALFIVWADWWQLFAW